MSAVILASGLVACSLDRSGETGAGGAAASASSASGSITSTDSAGPSSGAEVGASTVDASAGAGAGGDGGAGGGESSSSGDTGGDAPSSTTATATTTTTTTASTGTGGAEPVCGDGNLESGEECDDGDVLAGDRCGPTCIVEDPDSCPGTPIGLDVGVLEIADSTEGANDSFQDTQGADFCDGSYPGGSDLIYAVTPSTPGTLRAVLVADYARPYVTLRTACPTAPGSILACTYAVDAGDEIDVEDEVEAGGTYFVVVDTWAQQAGPFTLRLELTAR